MKTSDHAVAGAPRLILRAEGAAAGIAGTAVFAATGESWWLFALLLLAPDLSFLGYLAGTRAGAAAYNTLHSTVGPLALLAAGWWLGAGLALALGGTWLAHVGFDRLFGYGLKYGHAFQATHLGRIGRN